MSVSALIFLKYFRKYNSATKSTSRFKLEILSSLRLTGRDMFFVVHCGTDVIAFVLSPSGAFLMGRWKYEQNEDN